MAARSVAAGDSTGLENGVRVVVVDEENGAT
jgi:hypothetical protein